MAKNKDKPRREESMSDEIEYLRGENRELRAKLLKAQRELKSRKSTKEEIQKLEDLAKDVVKKRQIKTAIEQCPECKEGQLLESTLKFGKMKSCNKCKYVQVIKQGE